MKKEPRTRLPKDRRRSEILHAARRILDREGIAGFSLEAVAREIGVVPSLTRHYFGGHSGLLKAAVSDVLKAVEAALLDPAPDISLEARFTAYLDVLSQSPWGHAVWLGSAETHPDIDAIVRKGRRRMSESILGRPWAQLSQRERIHARGCIGFIEAVVADWIADGQRDRAMVIEVAAKAVRTLRSSAPAEAAKSATRRA